MLMFRSIFDTATRREADTQKLNLAEQGGGGQQGTTGEVDPQRHTYIGRIAV